MARLRLIIRNYFGFSKTETNGFLVLVPLMVFLLFAPTLYVRLFSREYDPSLKDQPMLDSLLAIWEERLVEKKPGAEPAIVREPFDPNTVDQQSMISMGIPRFLTRRIDNYRQKGGKFKIKADLSRIYDFPDSLYKALESYILLPDELTRGNPANKEVNIGSSSVKEAETRVQTPSLEIEKSYEQAKLWIDLNNCDTTELKQLRGIGSGYSRRIIKYRNLLGGFTSKEQLLEVYGLKDSLYYSLADQVYVQEGEQVDQINVNIATFKTLNSHPYISYKQAGDILNTRSKRGKFRSPFDLLVVQGMDSVSIQRLAPYLTY